MTDIFVDADACPVKGEVIRVAERHQLKVRFVSNSWIRLETGPLVERVVVSQGLDEADNWIVDHVSENDIVVTADVPLAAHCVKKRARVLGPTGKPFTEATIGMAVAMRDLNSHLRETGEISGNNPSFTARDRSTFLQALEQIIRRVKSTR